MKESDKSSLNALLLHLHELFRRYFNHEASQHEQDIIDIWEVPIDQVDNPVFTEKMIEEDRIEIYSNIEKYFGIRKENRDRKFKRLLLITKKQIAIVAMLTILLGTSTYFLLINRTIKSEVGITQESSINKLYYRTQAKEIKQIALPDGSSVYLNNGSELYIIKNEFNKKKREVWINGEAFFDVAKDTDKSFIIHSGELQTLVHGTSFNIKAYKELGEYVVSVKSGRVEILAHEKTIGILTHNEQIIFESASQEHKIEETDWQDDSGWIQGRTILKDASFNELKLRILLHFGVNLDCKSNRFKEARLNAIIMKESTLKEVMDNICWLYGAKYTITNNKVMILD